VNKKSCRPGARPYYGTHFLIGSFASGGARHWTPNYCWPEGSQISKQAACQFVVAGSFVSRVNGLGEFLGRQATSPHLLGVSKSFAPRIICVQCTRNDQWLATPPNIRTLRRLLARQIRLDAVWIEDLAVEEAVRIGGGASSWSFLVHCTQIMRGAKLFDTPRR
jgi:hypothetical protein